MAYTPKIVSSEKSVRNSVSQAEWGARQYRPEWAAVLREFDRVDASYRD